MYDLHFHGWGGALVGSLARGFAWSVGWMVARGMGLPIACGVLLVVLVFMWLRRRNTAR